MTRKVLVCDDERNVRTFLHDLLALEGFAIAEAATAAEALEAAAARPDLCILDLMLPDRSGIELIPDLKEAAPHMAIIVITAVGTVDNAVLSMKAGAYDFITKPFDVETVLIAVRRAVDYISVSNENIVLRNLQRNRMYFEEFVGESRSVQAIKDLIPRLAAADVPILVTGETGTGKNVLAKQIHFSLSRADAPLVYANCSSIPAPLFESELFGYEKGAFTGAVAQKKGRVELADGGTLLLDEITELPPEMQAKLLDFLQERRFYRVGGVKPVSVQARVIALTNKDLREEIKEGRFRPDLFYRLNVIHFAIPPLRERGDDLRMICDYLVQLFRKKYNMPGLSISEGAMRLIRSYSWPGNVRELKNSLERAVICAEGETIGADSLSFDEEGREASKLELKDIIEEYEREVILRRLAYFKGNRTRTAADLGISLRNLQYKLERYGEKA